MAPRFNLMPAAFPMKAFSLITFPDTPPFTFIPALLLPEIVFSLKTFPVGVSTRMMPLVLSVSVFSTTTFCVEFRIPLGLSMMPTRLFCHAVLSLMVLPLVPTRNMPSWLPVT